MEEPASDVGTQSAETVVDSGVVSAQDDARGPSRAARVISVEGNGLGKASGGGEGGAGGESRDSESGSHAPTRHPARGVDEGSDTGCVGSVSELDKTEVQQILRQTPQDSISEPASPTHDRREGNLPQANRPSQPLKGKSVGEAHMATSPVHEGSRAEATGSNQNRNTEGSGANNGLEGTVQDNAPGTASRSLDDRERGGLEVVEGDTSPAGATLRRPDVEVLDPRKGKEGQEQEEALEHASANSGSREEVGREGGEGHMKSSEIAPGTLGDGEEVGREGDGLNTSCTASERDVPMLDVAREGSNATPPQLGENESAQDLPSGNTSRRRDADNDSGSDMAASDLDSIAESDFRGDQLSCTWIFEIPVRLQST
jgi:hypothetical protein